MNTVILADQPVAPSKVVCLGRNYVEHIAELGNSRPEQMVFFFKPNSSISADLKSSHGGEELHYEAEICFGVVGGTLAYIGFGLDLTKRKLQSALKTNGLPWERAKAFQGSAVFSEFQKFSGNTDELEVELLIDGVQTQIGSVEQMINRPEEILEEAKSFTEFEDFDILMTGTPKGVGTVSPGSVFEGVVSQRGVELTRAKWLAQ
ncbi:fumarylacetoacetate hydrolase family protein [Pelagicoccus albus]|uniref:Fumarylacetoacetate hydrolase family protein n=1 Tax=Pelagicoccus albus TaxID=415222 RepID=A0A7X1B5F6_9BACT|nr:fumarylacetoacetate hydrolase family protein [Pelagicoccus albus]